MHALPPMQMTARALILQKPRHGAGLGVMLVGKGGAADEVGGASPCSSGFLQLGAVRGRGRCAGQLRQRAGAVGPVALAVSFGGLGCFGSIPGSPW